jgi:hypothetical protein
MGFQLRSKRCPRGLPLVTSDLAGQIDVGAAFFAKGFEPALASDEGVLRGVRPTVLPGPVDEGIAHPAEDLGQEVETIER